MLMEIQSQLQFLASTFPQALDEEALDLQVTTSIPGVIELATQLPQRTVAQGFDVGCKFVQQLLGKQT